MLKIITSDNLYVETRIILILEAQKKALHMAMQGIE